MKPLIKIVLRDAEPDILNKIESSVQDLLETLSGEQLLPPNIIEICITDSFQAEVEALAKEWNVPSSLSHEKEFFAVTKNVSKANDPFSETKVIINSIYCNDILGAIAGQIIMIIFEQKLPEELLKIGVVRLSNEPKSILKGFCRDWLPHIWGRNLYTKLGLVKPANSSQVISYVNFILRNMKKAHWEYQATLDVGPLWASFLKLFGAFIMRCIEPDNILQFTKELGSFQKPLELFIGELSKLAEDTLNGKIADFEKLIPSFYEIAKCCCLDISYRAADWSVLVPENPKVFFDAKCLDTEQRIVGFSDILGFSKLIENYDNDPSSNLLVNVKNALDNAIKYSFRLNYKSNATTNNLLEYRQFSDCLCLSIPYFNNPEDFLVQLSVVCTTLACYQIALLNSNILIRGGLSVGSYYSDDNMIFSGGLVAAADADKRGAPPCLIIHDSLVTRLKNYDRTFLIENGILNLFAVDISTDAVFLNPFGTYKFSKYVRKKLLSNIDSLKSDLGDDELGKAAASILDLSAKQWEQIFETAIPEQLNKSIADFVALNLKWIENSIEIYNSNPNLRSKYAWLRNYLQWVSGSGDSHFKNFLGDFQI